MWWDAEKNLWFFSVFRASVKQEQRSEDSDIVIGVLVVVLKVAIGEDAHRRQQRLLQISAHSDCIMLLLARPTRHCGTMLT